MSRVTPIQILFLTALLLFVLTQRGFFDHPLGLIVSVVAIVFAITVHEANHAFVAVKLGDPTPREMGRVTLNPLRHLDPIGTLLLFVAGFGWGKPVLFNPSRLRIDPAIGSALVSAAGPAANMIAAILVAVLLPYVEDAEPLWTVVLRTIVQFNIILAVFNLLPIPPLDGFGVVRGLAPKSLAIALAPVERFGPLILIALIALPAFGGPNLLGQVMLPVIRSLERLMLG